MRSTILKTPIHMAAVIKIRNFDQTRNGVISLPSGKRSYIVIYAGNLGYWKTLILWAAGS